MKMSAETEGKLREAIDRMPMALAGLSDEFLVNQLLLAGNMVIESANALLDDVTPKLYRDYEFAVNDFVQGCDELLPSDRSHVERCVMTLREATDEIRTIGSLPADVIERMRSLRDKLAARNREIERRRFVPKDVDLGPLPYEVPELSPVASELRDVLTAAGFETPWMDELAAGPRDFGVLAAEQTIEEIDAIAG